MKYNNPVISGFYPDPSVCEANGRFYLVTSSFQYFPGVPLFESEDLVNWKQISHVLTRKSQVELDKVRSSGGVFAPTIRYNDGRFYMVTNNNSTNRNFYVYTDDIYGEWSDPIEIDMDGIDPSILFDDGHAYFITNGTDDNGNSGIVQCEIDIESGKKLSAAKLLWKGSGGRYLESPHMYKIGKYYYLMVAEGGTEYGHMVTYARSESVWGPFENYEKNPILTNRNKAPYMIQGIGHGDLIQNNDGRWYIVTLGFRQIDTWEPYHNLGREVYLTPAAIDDAGNISCGNDGTTDLSYEIPGTFEQTVKKEYTFTNTSWDIDWAYLRYHHPENYELSNNKAVLHGTDITLDDVDSPTFIAMRQKDFRMEAVVDITISTNNPSNDTAVVSSDTASVSGKTDTENTDTSLKSFYTNASAGMTVYMNEDEHYDIELVPSEIGIIAQLKLNIGGIKHIECAVNHAVLRSSTPEAIKHGLPANKKRAKLIIRSDNLKYDFYVQFPSEISEAADEAAGSNSSLAQNHSSEIYLGSGRSKYLSSEVSGGFTGTMLGLYAVGNCTAEFTGFSCKYSD